MSSILVTEVRLMPGRPRDRDAGLLGWVSCTVGATLRLDGLALRRTREGRLALSFPCRRDRQGRKHPLVRPLDDAARVSIERQILAALRLEEAPR